MRQRKRKHQKKKERKKKNLTLARKVFPRENRNSWKGKDSTWYDKKTHFC